MTRIRNFRSAHGASEFICSRPEDHRSAEPGHLRKGSDDDPHLLFSVFRRLCPALVQHERFTLQSAAIKEILNRHSGHQFSGVRGETMAVRPEFTAPTSEESPAGHLIYKRSHSPYERFVESEGIPIVRGVGVYDTREVELGSWERVGGRGAYLFLDGIGSQKGMHLVEVPARGELKTQRHLFDSFYLVIDGRGTTEVWKNGSSRKHSFEWATGSLFTVPMNANFRFVNAGSSPALLLAANNCPPVMNIFQDPNFVFNPPLEDMPRFDENEDFFKPKTDLQADEVRGRAAVESNVFPDIINCDLPLDNQRAPGYRRIQPYFHGFMRDGNTGGFISQYPTGRYSKAHYHASGAVLVCLQG